MKMNSVELRTKISSWNLSQSEFARWLEVSPGAVTQWLAETRAIPGPVAAFIKLFESLPPSLQTIHLSHVKKGSADMEGMYVVEFVGSAGDGGATLTFKDGMVYGFDLGRGVYDGYYRSSSVPGMTDVEVVVKMPAGIPSVIRGIIQPFDWAVVAKASIPTNTTSVEVLVATNLGETVRAKFTRMRDLPMAA
jgi:hypothetical protein